jgi:Clp amino terminal domain, pathogenicity island component
MHAWERFSVEAQHLLLASQIAARELGLKQINPEHLLMACCLGWPNLISAARGELQAGQIPQEQAHTVQLESHNLVFSDSSKRILAYAVEESERQRLRKPPEILSLKGFVKPAHILLGLLREGGATGRILESWAMTLDGVRDRLD